MGSNPTLSAILFYVFVLLLSSVERSSASTDYPPIFPSAAAIFGENFRKDAVFVGTGLAFSFWGKRFSLNQPTMDRTSYMTIPRIMNFIYSNITRTSEEGKNAIRMKDFDAYLAGEYFFSRKVFTNLVVFVRNRTFNEVSSFGLGDVNLNLMFVFLEKPQVFGSFGALIPLSGDPDEELVVFQRVNISSFGLDLPIYLMVKMPFETRTMNWAILTSGGYIFRMSYPLFGQIIKPGDVAVGSLGFMATLKNFFPTSSDTYHDLAFGLFWTLNHGFPEKQMTGIYRVEGISWNAIKVNINAMGKFRKKEEVFGSLVLKDWFNLVLSMSFTVSETGFINLNYPDYAIMRFPYLDRTKLGIYTGIGLVFIL